MQRGTFRLPIPGPGRVRRRMTLGLFPTDFRIKEENPQTPPQDLISRQRHPMTRFPTNTDSAPILHPLAYGFFVV